MKRIYKYGTGDVVPEGAIYLSSVANGFMSSPGKNEGLETAPRVFREDGKKFVWHYFLVEVKE
jgi:hypothetical protein